MEQCHLCCYCMKIYPFPALPEPGLNYWRNHQLQMLPAKGSGASSHYKVLLLSASSGKGEGDTTFARFTEGTWKIIRAHSCA